MSSFDLALLLYPLSLQQVVSFSQSSCVSPVDLTDGMEAAGWGGVNSHDGEKAWSSINQSMLSDGEDSCHQRDVMNALEC